MNKKENFLASLLKDIVKDCVLLNFMTFETLIGKFELLRMWAWRYLESCGIKKEYTFRNWYKCSILKEDEILNSKMEIPIFGTPIMQMAKEFKLSEHIEEHIKKTLILKQIHENPGFDLVILNGNVIHFIECRYSDPSSKNDLDLLKDIWGKANLTLDQIESMIKVLFMCLMICF
jgi:hypothetical protein